MFLLSILAFAANAQNATDNSTKLEITDLDVKVGSKTDKGLSDGDTIGDEAMPGDKIEFKFELTNFYTDDEDVEIQDVVVTITIEGVDDDDDLEEETDEFDIKADDNEKDTLSFEIPYEVDAGTYNVVIQVEGDGENDVSYDFEWNLDLEVEKEKHLLYFTEARVADDSVDCGKSTTLDIGVLNIGEEDEEDVDLTITNSDFDLSLSDRFDVDEGAFDDDVKYSKDFTIEVPDDAEAGAYILDVRVSYNDGKDSEETQVTLNVECGEEEVPSEEEDGEDVEVVLPPEDETTPPAVIYKPAEQGLFGGDSLTWLIILAELIIIVVGIVVVTIILRRK